MRLWFTSKITIAFICCSHNIVRYEKRYAFVVLNQMLLNNNNKN
jgi:hypothetical protein